MAEPSTHIYYSFEDIQRYLQKKMSSAEMHSIEKAALQDALLADAIEGYNEADTNFAQKNLNELNAELLSEHKQSKLILFNKKTKWLRIAALVIIIAGVGIISAYFFKTSNRQQQIAKIKQEETNKNIPAKNSELKTLNKQNVISDTQSAIAQKKNQPKLASSSKKENKNKLTLQNTNNNETTAITNIGVASPVQPGESDSTRFALESSSKQNEDSVPDILSKRISGISIAPTIFSGKVTDEKNQPVVGAFVEATDKSITVLTDNNGYFRLFKSDTILKATAGIVGYKSKTITLQPGDSNSIVLTQNNTVLNNVVVVGYGSKKLKTANQTATPVGGWENFNNYVLSKLDRDSSNNNSMSTNDEVEMEFLINDAGNPYNIKIIKPLDERRNLRAIEILKNGPKWISASKKKKAKLKINF